MANYISVNVDELKKCARRIQKQLSRYDGKVAELEGQDFGQLGTGWKSSDNQTFLNNAADYISDLKQLSAEIDAYATFLNTVAEQYDHRVKDNCSIANAAKGK